jgi:hypothetical protein
MRGRLRPNQVAALVTVAMFLIGVAIIRIV